MKQRICMAVCATIAAITALAAEPDTLRLAEVTVTAIKQSADLSRQASAITVLDRGDVERNNVMTSRAATTQVPNVFIPDYGSRMTSTIYVRGIGTRIDQPAVGLTVDNVPVMCKENYDVDLVDIGRVETLRGPQSTLFGRNTLGGVMNVYTLSPLNYQGTRVLAQYGSHNTWRLGGGHYARPKPQLGLAATAYCTSTGGEFTNQYNGRRTDWERQGSGRIKVDWLPADGWQVANVLSLSVSRQGGYPYEYLATGQIAYNDTCFYRRTSVMDGLTVTHRGPWYSLSSITSYQYINDNMTLDQDFTTLPYFTLTQARREHAVTQDLVLRDIAAGQYHWLAGLWGFYRHMTMDAPVTFKDTGIASLIEEHVNEAIPAYPVMWDTREFVLGSHFTSPTWGMAAYHQSTLQLGQWTLTAGVRLDYEHSTLRYHSETHTGYSIWNRHTDSLHGHEAIDIDDRGHLSKDFFEVLPRLSVVWQPSENRPHTIHASVSRGSKAGGFNTQMFSDVLQQRLMGMMGIGASYDVDRIVGYKPERAWNYEVGAHLASGNNRLTADVGLFYMDCRNRQLTVFPDGTTTGRVMTNAGQTRSLGVEAALQARLTERTTLVASYGWCDARFVKYHDGKADYKDKQVPYSPAHTLFAEARHNIGLGGDNRTLTLAVNVQGAGHIHWNEANTVTQPFYALLGANATLQLKHIGLQLWGTNLTGTRYRTFYFVSIGHEFLQRGHGRALGATLRLNFNT